MVGAAKGTSRLISFRLCVLSSRFWWPAKALELVHHTGHLGRSLDFERAILGPGKDAG